MVLGSGTVLSAGPPDVSELARHLAAPHRWVELAGPDAAVASLAGALLWLVALWVATGLALTACSLLPGRVGVLARAVAHRLTPAALRRVVGAAAGASILLSPATALAAPGAAGSPGPPSGAPTATIPAIGWPTDPSSRPADAAAGVPSARPSPGAPAGPSGSTSAAVPSRSTVPIDSGSPLPTDPGPSASHTGQSSSASRTSSGPSAPAAAPVPAPRTAPLPPGTRRQDGSNDHLAGRVTVRPGDSLWSIAARRLGSNPSANRVQAEWPRWYAANRSLIGADPDLILPGTRLRAPRPADAEPVA